MKSRVVRNALVAVLLVGCSGDDLMGPDDTPNRPTRIANAIGVDAVTGASIETNKDDYVPGEIVHVVLKGWKPGEDVRLFMSESPDTHGDVDTTVTVDIDGEWSGHYYDVAPHDIGATFTLVATGLESGSSATVTFTDSYTLTITSAPPAPAVGASFNITVQVSLTNGDDWNATRIRLVRSGSTVYELCHNTPDYNNADGVNSGPHTEIISIPGSGTGWIGGTSLIAGSYTLLVEGADNSSNSCSDSDDRFPNPAATQSFGVSVTPFLIISKVANSDPICDTGGGDPDFCAGAAATYTLSVTNTGQNSTSGTITVTDTLPASAGDLDDKITFVSGVGTGWTCVLSGTTVAAPPRHIVSCTTSDVIANGGTKVITLNVNALADGSDWTDVDNRVWVVGGGDATASADTARADVRQPPNFFIQSIVITPQPVAPGGTASANVTVIVDNGAFWRCMRGRVRQSDGSSLTGFSTDVVTDFEPDHSDGSHSQSFNFTVPAVAGTYGLRVRVYSDDVSGGCDSDEEEGFVTFLVQTPSNISTTTQVLAAPSPSVFGQSVTFTATVTPASGPAATGSVSFYEFTGVQSCTALGGAVALGTDGTAPFEYTTTTLSVATHTISACFTANTGWTNSSDDVAHTVNKSNASVTVTDNPTSSNFGQSVTFTAALAAVAPGVGTPTGTVTFYEFTGGQTCALPGAAVGSSDASLPYEFTTSLLGVGSHTITACYGGNTNFNGNSGTDTHSVSAIGTTTEVLASPSPSVFGQSVTFTATVTPASGPAATGTVNFYEFTGVQTCNALGGAVALGTDGSAPFQFSTSSLSRASHTISACYVPDAGWAESGDDVVHAVNKANVTVGVSDNPTASVFGESVTFTATVTAAAPGTGTPTGTVTFYEFTGVQSCTSPGGATGSADASSPWVFTTTSLSVGAHTITACYEGDGNFNTNSSDDAHSVGKADASVTVTDNPTSSVWGQSVTFTAALAAVAPGAGTPTGTVTFYEFTGVQSCTALGGAVALGSDNTFSYQYTTTTLSVGAHTITACYGGDGNFNDNSGSDAHTVGKASTSVTVTDSPTSGQFGTSITFTAAVAAVLPGAGTPTGTVTFYEFGAGESCASPPASPLGSATSAPYTYQTNSLSVGAHTISACYPGDGNFFGNDGSDTHTVSQVVTTTALAVAPASQQYSDKTVFTATVTPHTVLTSSLTGTVYFYVGTVEQACGTSAPAGDVGNDAIANADDGVASITYTIDKVPSTTPYVVTACFYSSNNDFLSSKDTESLTVNKEDASAYDGSGGALLIGQTGGTFTFKIRETFGTTASEKNPPIEKTNGLVAPGDISSIVLANVSFQIKGVLTNSNTFTMGTCQALSDNNVAGYGGILSGSCVIPAIPNADTYEIDITINGTHYSGGGTGIVQVTDPNAGFATGGGWYYYDPSALVKEKVNFGFMAKATVVNGKKINYQGSVLMIRHKSDGTVIRIKSNVFDGYSIKTQGVTCPQATFSGKANYFENGVSLGNLPFTGFGEDCGEPGTTDKFGMFHSYSPNFLATTAILNQLAGSAKIIVGGNIQVPKQ